MHSLSAHGRGERMCFLKYIGAFLLPFPVPSLGSGEQESGQKVGCRRGGERAGGEGGAGAQGGQGGAGSNREGGRVGRAAPGERYTPLANLPRGLPLRRFMEVTSSLFLVVVQFLMGRFGGGGLQLCSGFSWPRGLYKFSHVGTVSKGGGLQILLWNRVEPLEVIQFFYFPSQGGASEGPFLPLMLRGSMAVTETLFNLRSYPKVHFYLRVPCFRCLSVFLGYYLAVWR
eukprot:Gb_08221 [translate_table: standard]